jgi:hypothetical protein
MECVAEEELVEDGAGWVGGAAGGNGSFAVLVRVDIEAAAGKKESLGGGEKLGDAVGAFVEGDEDDGGADGVQGSEVGREGALVVFGVGGRLGDGDAQRHGQQCKSPQRRRPIVGDPDV